MQFTALILAAIGASTVSAQYANVVNGCKNPAYVQSYPDDGSAPGPEITLQPQGRFSEPYRTAGSTIKMGTLPQLRAPLEFGYSRSDNPSLVYYELVNKYGNPFAGDMLEVAASRNGCQSIMCQVNDSSCYNKVVSCGRPANVTAYLCSRGR